MRSTPAASRVSLKQNFLSSKVCTGSTPKKGRSPACYDAVRAFTEQHPDASRLAAIAKTYASDVAMSVASAGVQVHGGAGYVRDFPVEMLMRDAKINQIYEGTNQILRMVIARTYFGELAR